MIETKDKQHSSYHVLSLCVESIAAFLELRPVTTGGMQLAPEHGGEFCSIYNARGTHLSS